MSRDLVYVLIDLRYYTSGLFLFG